jgi:alpha-L-fucosidase
MPRLVREVRAKQPKLIVVDRAVPGEQQNYLTPEQHIPENGLPYPWETCMTMGNSWSYVPNDVYKPANEIIEKLVDIVSKGGNYLLNIGPGPDGELDPNAYQRLKEIGAWMKVNGEAIYGSRIYNSFSEGESIRYTQSKDGNTKYIFLFNYPEAKQLLTKIKFSKKTKLQLLGSKSKLSWKQVENCVEINLPDSLKSVTDFVWVIKVTN